MTTISEAYRWAMRARRQWRDAKDQRTLAGHYAAVAAYWTPSRRLDSITKADVLDWIDHMQKTLSGSTTNHRLSFLSVLFKESDLTPPKMPRMTIRKGRIRVFTAEEIDAFLAEFMRWGLAGNDMFDLTRFLLQMSCRLDEACSLKWKDVTATTLAIWQNKADHPRVLVTTRVTREILERRRGHTTEGPFETLDVDRADKRWAKARRAVGLANDPEAVIHALRHTSLSRLAAKGVDAFRLQAWAGHKKIETTLRYVHLFGPAMESVAAAQDALHAVSLDPTPETVT